MRPIPAGSPVAGKAGAIRFTPGAPARPKHLGRLARKVWDRTAAELEKAGLLTHADGDVLAVYAATVADLETVLSATL
jgi:phage terminase small subunit